MKSLPYRFSALLLALLLLLGCGPQMVLAADQIIPDPSIRLGTAPGDMLAGGGKQVRTDNGIFYLNDADGYVYNSYRGTAPVYQGTASKLNYSQGILYFVRQGEGTFDLCAYNTNTGGEQVFLSSFAGTVRQMYLVADRFLDFSCDNAIWQLDITTGEYRLIRFVRDLWSFVPTGCGLIYATGTLFDYSIYAESRLLAEHADDYNVDFDLGNGTLIYTVRGVDYQMDLGSAFLGVAAPTAYQGYSYVALAGNGSDSVGASPENPEAAQAEIQAEFDRLERELGDIWDNEENHVPQDQDPVDNDTEAQAPDPADADPLDPQPIAEALEPETQETVPQEPETQMPENPPFGTVPIQPDLEKPARPSGGQTVILLPETTEPAETESPVTVPSETEPVPTEPLVTEPLPTEPLVTEPLPTESPVAEPLPTEPAVTEPEPTVPVQPYQPDQTHVIVQPSLPTAVQTDDGAIRRAQSAGIQNIVKRARQMTGIKWTPRQDIQGWNYGSNGITFKQGVTYTGLPYGQSGAYVPWVFRLSDGTYPNGLSKFVQYVNDPNSKMYTARGGNGGKTGPYYSTDCSAFVSWAWGTGSRQIVRGLMYDSSISVLVGKKYTQIQVGDAFCYRTDSGAGHTVLVTDVTYDPMGAIQSVELSEANITKSCGTCRVFRYTGTTELLRMENAYFNKATYAIYRNINRDKVGYTHDCAIPLEGDECALCGAGKFLKPGADVSYAQGVIDWQRAAEELGFAIIRVGYTPSGKVSVIQPQKDSQYDNNVKGATNYDLPYGLYYYAGATTVEQARQEAEYVLGILMQNGYYPSLPIFYDVEENSNILSLNDTQLLQVISGFCEVIENFGFRAGVYASTSVWNSRMSSDSYNSWARWVAQWDSPVNTAQKGAHVWQYTNNGRVSGVATAVDLDYWLGSVGDLSHRYKTTQTSATCTQKGALSYTCLDCGQTVSKAIPALGHSFKNGVCARCGHVGTVFDQFQDLNPNSWYAEAVQYTLNKGVFTGTTQVTFSPGAPMNRAMMITVLYRLAGQPAIQAEQLFADVKPTSYYGAAVTWGSHLGIVQGTGANTFSPNQEVTREQAATFFYRYASSMGLSLVERANLTRDFPDGDRVGDFAKDALAWAVGAGIIQGSNVGGTLYLNPKASATRAQMAVMVMRFADYLEARGFAVLP